MHDQGGCSARPPNPSVCGGAVQWTPELLSEAEAEEGEHLFLTKWFSASHFIPPPPCTQVDNIHLELCLLSLMQIWGKTGHPTPFPKIFFFLTTNVTLLATQHRSPKYSFFWQLMSRFMVISADLTSPHTLSAWKYFIHSAAPNFAMLIPLLWLLLCFKKSNMTEHYAQFDRKYIIMGDFELFTVCCRKW